jgi:hypothetical protein
LHGRQRADLVERASQVSPQVSRRSMETAQLSATAQRLGEVKKISEVVSVPLPRNSSLPRFLARPCSSIRISPS